MTIIFSCLETAYGVFIIVEVMIKQLNVNLSETMGTTCSKRVFCWYSLMGKHPNPRDKR